MSRIAQSAAIAFAALAASGCCFLNGVRFIPDKPLPEPVAYVDQTVDPAKFRRVLALPLFDESNNGIDSETVSRILRDELSKLHRFEMVQATESDAILRPADTPQRNGRIPIETVVELGRRYGVDAVLFGSITRYRPYAPPALALNVSIVDVETGTLVVAVNDFVDAADAAAAESMHRFFVTEVDTQGTEYGAELMSTSPEWFTRFATRRVARSLAGS